MGAFIKRALGTDIVSLEQVCNDPRFQEAIIPAGNLAGTAEEASRFFQMMLNGGKWGRRRICSERTVARAVQEFGSRTLDRTLFIPMRFSAGLMLGDEPFGVWGPNTRQAFGHVGLINKFAWADPQRDLSAAVLTSGIPVIAHHIPALLNVMRGIANTIPLREDPTPFALRLA
jgi:CubicO group peptidase (beta-lactamase class C family)